MPPEVSVTVTGLNDTVVPPGGAEWDNATVPTKPFNEVNVTVDIPEPPGCIVRELGERLMLKSAAGGGGGGPEPANRHAVNGCSSQPE